MPASVLQMREFWVRGVKEFTHNIKQTGNRMWVCPKQTCHSELASANFNSQLSRAQIKCLILMSAAQKASIGHLCLSVTAAPRGWQGHNIYGSLALSSLVMGVKVQQQHNRTGPPLQHFIWRWSHDPSRTHQRAGAVTQRQSKSPKGRGFPFGEDMNWGLPGDSVVISAGRGLSFWWRSLPWVISPSEAPSALLDFTG